MHPHDHDAEDRCNSVALPKTSEEALEDVLDAIAVRPAPGADASSSLRYIGRTTSRSLPFVFGGQLVAQALWAAYQQVPPTQRVQVLHAHFVAAGDPNLPLLVETENIRDAGSTSVHRVTVTQQPEDSAPRVVLTASAAFGSDRRGLEHQPTPVSGLQVDPATLPTLDEWLAPHRQSLPDWWRGPMAVDLRYSDAPPHVLPPGSPIRDGQELWMRSAADLPDDPRLHDCLLAFASDLTLLDAVVLRHALSWYDGRTWAASLDHSIWFHQPARFDDWLLYEQRSPAARGGRGLATGEIFDADGRHYATVTQLGVLVADGTRGMPL